MIKFGKPWFSETPCIINTVEEGNAMLERRETKSTKKIKHLNGQIIQKNEMIKNLELQIALQQEANEKIENKVNECKELKESIQMANDQKADFQLNG